jgi:hypothetical protein
LLWSGFRSCLPYSVRMQGKGMKAYANDLRRSIVVVIDGAATIP